MCNASVHVGTGLWNSFATLPDFLWAVGTTRCTTTPPRRWAMGILVFSTSLIMGKLPSIRKCFEEDPAPTTP